jgi:hypothetical protein
MTFCDLWVPLETILFKDPLSSVVKVTIYLIRHFKLDMTLGYLGISQSRVVRKVKKHNISYKVMQ